MERIQKIVANRGYCSRRKAEELLQKGKIKVNGQTIYELGTLVNENDVIEVEGNVLGREEKEYILLYKPRGVVTTTSDDKHRKTVLDIVKKYDKKTNYSIVELTIHEGKNHQVKRMFEALGFEVVKLKRETFSFLNLSGLTSGEYRNLTAKEVKILYSEVSK